MTIEVKNDEMLGRTNNTTLHIELIKLQQENKILQDDFKCANEEIKRLKDRINKAIEYIENNRLFYFEYDEEEIFEHVTDLKVSEKLIEILKGENK